MCSRGRKISSKALSIHVLSLTNTDCPSYTQVFTKPPKQHNKCVDSSYRKSVNVRHKPFPF